MALLSLLIICAFSLAVSAFNPNGRERIIAFRNWAQRNERTLDVETFKGGRFEEIKFVEWAGCNGLLPLQRYKNDMDRKSYNRWLCKQIDLTPDKTTSIKATFVETSLKLQAESKASQVLNPLEHLRPIYVDSHIIVVNKPSGVLSGER